MDLNAGTSLVVQCPQFVKTTRQDRTVFLAGGSKPNWRDAIQGKFPGQVVYNPICRGVRLHERTTWEITHMNTASMVVFWFPKETGALSTLELGRMVAMRRPLVVGIDPSRKNADELTSLVKTCGIEPVTTLAELTTTAPVVPSHPPGDRLTRIWAGPGFLSAQELFSVGFVLHTAPDNVAYDPTCAMKREIGTQKTILTARRQKKGKDPVVRYGDGRGNTTHYHHLSKRRR